MAGDTDYCKIRLFAVYTTSTSTSAIYYNLPHDTSVKKVLSY